MGISTKVLGVSLVALTALSLPGLAWAQEAGQPPPSLPGAQQAPALSARDASAPLPASAEALPPVQLGKAWERVVGATFARMEQLPQAAAPTVLGNAPRQPPPDLLVVPPPSASQVPEAGPTFQLGPFRFTLAPIVVNESPVIANVRSSGAQLLGVTVRRL